MKTKLFLLIFFLFCIDISAQEHFCRVKEENDIIYRENPSSLKEKNAFDKFSREFATKEKNKSNQKRTATYTIPVVFHVYGSTQNGATVTYEKIVTALQKVNEDFNGLNDDYNSVEPFFQGMRGTLNIEFKLAKLTPTGACTTGVVFHPVKKGYGNGGGYDQQIQEDAWDNYKYMNVYIQSDLYNDGGTNNSGVAWYPNTWMSDNNLARVVYNGLYLHGNTNNEFASVLSHEFGHFLNLIHTFEGGCSGTDQVDDTPEEDGRHALGCSSGTNCTGNRVNFENYMGYNGAAGCYKMFTQGQITRMLAALQHPARITLWQPENLTATGVNNTGSSLAAATTLFKEDLVNNGSFSTSSTILLNGGAFSVASGTLSSGTHFTHNFPAGIIPVLTVNNNSQLTLTLSGNAINHAAANSNVGSIAFLPSAFTGGTNGMYCTGLDFTLRFTDPYGIYYRDMPDATVNAGTTWKYFVIDKGDSPAYGAWQFAANHLKMETYDKRLVCNPGTRNVTKLGFNVPVNGTRSFVAPAPYPGQPDIRTSSYTPWDGQTGYIGFEYSLDGLPCYGWFKVNVNADGSGYTVTEYAYNTEPYGTIYTGMTPKVMLSVSPAILTEAISNNGSFSSGVSVQLATNNGTFTQSSGTLIQGTHYTVSGVPAGLTAVLTFQNNTGVELTLTGNAIQHMESNTANVTVTFLDPAITGGTTTLETATFNVNLKFMNPYGIYYVDNEDFVVNPTSTWMSFQIDADADDKYYGIFVDEGAQNALKLETYTKSVICNGATKNITLLGYNEPVDATRNMVTGGAYPDLHVLRSPTYTVWDNQTGFIGFEYTRNGNKCYGWFRVIVSADGASYTLTDYAYNTQPNATIYTPNNLSTDDVNVKDNIAIYPNPFETQFTIDTSGILGKDVSVTIANILGQKVYEEGFNGVRQNIAIETGLLNPGIYFVQLSVDNKMLTVNKMIKR